MFKSLYRRAVLWIMSTPLYHDVVMKVIPYIRFTTYYTDMQGYKYKIGRRLIQPGDIILVQDRRKATGMLIPGTWDHAGLVVDTGAEAVFETVEMTHHDYSKTCFADMAFQADRFAIFRCPDFTPEYIKDVVIPTALSFDGAKYDVKFQGAESSVGQLTANLHLGIPALYCSELVYQSDPERRLKADLSDLIGINRPYISPDGLAASNVICICDSDLIPLPPELKK